MAKEPIMVEALLYERLENNAVRCNLCSHRCTIKEGQRGRCSVRENQGGTLVSLVYGQLVAAASDPVEKKPIWHLAPGSLSYSVASVGCNFSCSFCQNAEISQLAPDDNGRTGITVTPEQTVAEALNAGARSIAFTYTEPTVAFEFVLDTARLARSRGLFTILVTNGFLTFEAIDLLAPYLTSANVDLKAFTEAFYTRYCRASLEPVKDAILYMKQQGVALEITTLVIPDLNDGAEELKEIARFIAEGPGIDTPWHLSRFYPTYRMTDHPPTPMETILMARDIGIEAGLRYVYTGNLPHNTGENTFCYGCGKAVIQRSGYRLTAVDIKDNRCSFCGTYIDGIDIDGQTS